jgi:hypothetical protein
VTTEVDGRYDDPKFLTRNSESEVLHYVGIVSAQRPSDLTVEKIERIIEMDQYGNTSLMDVVFESGRLALKAQPKQGGSR